MTTALMPACYLCAISVISLPWIPQVHAVQCFCTWCSFCLKCWCLRAKTRFFIILKSLLTSYFIWVAILKISHIKHHNPHNNFLSTYFTLHFFSRFITAGNVIPVIVYCLSFQKYIHYRGAGLSYSCHSSDFSVPRPPFVRT